MVSVLDAVRDLGILGRRPRVSLEVESLWMSFSTSGVCVCTRLKSLVQFYFLLPFKIFINYLNYPDSYLIVRQRSKKTDISSSQLIARWRYVCKECFI
jgi:hypothetical protein